MNAHTIKRIAHAAAVSFTLFGLCAEAQAQTVRKCQIGGQLVFQSSPCPIEATVTASVPPTAAAESPAALKKKTLADLLRERDGADRNRPAVREFQGDGANVLRSRMGAV